MKTQAKDAKAALGSSGGSTKCCQFQRVLQMLGHIFGHVSYTTLVTRWQRTSISTIAFSDQSLGTGPRSLVVPNGKRVESFEASCRPCQRSSYGQLRGKEAWEEFQGSAGGNHLSRTSSPQSTRCFLASMVLLVPIECHKRLQGWQRPHFLYLAKAIVYDMYIKPYDINLQGPYITSI